MSSHRRRPAGRGRARGESASGIGTLGQREEWARPNGGGRHYQSGGRGVRQAGNGRAAGSQPRRAAGGGRGGNGSNGGRGNRRYAARREPNRSWWRKLLSWKALGFGALGTFLLGVIGVAVAYAMTPVPDGNEFARTQATIIYWNDGETELGRFSAENREIVPIDDIPVHVQQAVVAAEDRSFYQNSGFDPIGIARAAWHNVVGGEIRSGGSTITQQYVKNYYLTQEQTFTRKLKELFISVKIDQRMSKEAILEDYLNTIWFGRGTLHGVQTASKSYFGKPVTELSVEEGAALAALIRNPRLYDPTASEENKARFEERFRFVLNGMVEIGAIDAATAEAAEVPEVQPKPQDNQFGGTDGYLIEQVRQELLDAGFTEQEIHTGGLRVITTFDRKAQQAAVEAVEQEFPTDEDGDPVKDLNVGLAAVRPNDGAVVAMYGGPDYVERARNDALSRLQPGSTMKAFGLLAALEEGISLDSVFQGDSPIEDERLGERDFVNNQNDVDYGDVDLVRATEKSINTAFVDLTFELGYEKVQDAIIRAGIPEDSPALDVSEYRTLLGIFNVSPVEMAEGYATIASGGKHADWYTVKRVTDPWGSVRHEVDPEPQRVFDADVVADATYALTQVVESDEGTGTAARDLERPAAVKTGTHEDKTSWFAGFTPQLAATVMYYNGDGGEESSLRGIVSGGTDDEPFPGGGVPARTWTAFMKGALEGEPVIEFPPRADVGEPLNTPTPTPTCPEGTEGEPPDCEPTAEPTPTLTCPPGWTGEPPDCERPEPERIEVPDVRNRPEDEAIQRLRDAGFNNIDSQPFPVCSGAGTVLSQQPEPGQSAAPDELIVITVGEDAECERIPPVVGDDRETAIEKLERWNVIIEDANGRSRGTVVSVNPDVGTLHPVGDDVVIGVVPDNGNDND